MIKEEWAGTYSVRCTLIRQIFPSLRFIAHRACLWHSLLLCGHGGREPCCYMARVQEYGRVFQYRQNDYTTELHYAIGLETSLLCIA